MWQQIIVGVLVVAATIYAARKLGPRRWRAKPNGATGISGTAGCGCDKDGTGCH
jgi:hypothetical protein